MHRLTAEFLSRISTAVRFTDRLRNEELTKREVLMANNVKERRLIMGLRYESQEQCLTEHIDDVEVEGGAVAAFSPSASGMLEVSTMSRFMLCRCCGWGPHPIVQCTAPTGSNNAAGRVMTETAQEFERMSHLFLKGRSRGIYTQNPRRGAYSASRGRGGRGHFRPTPGAVR